VVDNMFTRLKGLIGHAPLKSGEGMLIMPCNSVHCMFMSFPIDVVYVNKQNQVIKVDPVMKPWATAWPVRAASYVIELAANAGAPTGIQPGDQLVLE